MRGTPISFTSPGRGGVNYLDSLATLQDFEARDLRNVVTTTRGAVKKRGGSTSWTVPPASLHSLAGFDNPRALLAAGGTGIYAFSTTGALTMLASAQAAGVRWEFAQAPVNAAEGPIWMMNGIDTPRQWTGAGAAGVWTVSAGTLPNGKYLLAAQGRLFAAGMVTYLGLLDPSSTLVWSDVGNPRAWTVNNYVQLDPTDGNAITGVGTSGPNLLVFKRRKAWLIYDLNTGANRRIGENVGCVAHRTIVETPEGTYFLSEDHGVMRTDGSSAQRISDRIVPLIQTMSYSQRASACASYFDDHYYLSFSTNGLYNDLMLDFDTRSDSWWVHTLGEQQMAIWDAGAGPKLYGAKGSEARISTLFEAGIKTDDGAAFQAYWQGPFHTLGRPEIMKRVRQIAFDGSGTISLAIAKDYRRSPDYQRDKTFATGAGLFGVNDGSLFAVNDGSYFGAQTFTVAQARATTPGVARAWSIQFGNVTADDFEVDSYTMLATERTN